MFHINHESTTVSNSAKTGAALSTLKLCLRSIQILLTDNTYRLHRVERGSRRCTLWREGEPR